MENPISEFVYQVQETFEVLGGSGTVGGSVSKTFPKALQSKYVNAVLVTFEIEHSLNSNVGIFTELSLEIANGARFGNFVNENFILNPSGVMIPTSGTWRYKFTDTSFDDRFINCSISYFYSDKRKNLIPNY
jgi:hypothetical protein